MHGEGIRQLTRDHTWVADQVEAGRLSNSEAARSPQRNLITRSLGSEAVAEVDIFGPKPLLRGDVVVLCSDGLYTKVPHSEIAELCRGFPPKIAAPMLIRLANDRGGPDNISAIVARLK